MEEKDQLIDNLLDKVAEQKKEIEVIKHPTFKTNMSICLDINRRLDNVYNIHSLDENGLILILSRIETLITSISESCTSNNVENTYVHYGYPLEDWKNDIVIKLKMVQSQRKLKNLKVIEDKLSKLMSQEKKDMLEILAITKLLGL